MGLLNKEHFIYNVYDGDNKTGRQESFNLNKVVRSIWLEDNFTVLLDDGHEETMQVGEMKDKQGKVVAINKRMHLASQIILKGEDINRFFETIK